MSYLDTQRQTWPLKEIAAHQIRTMMWTLAVTNGLNFLREGGKTGGSTANVRTTKIRKTPLLDARMLF